MKGFAPYKRHPAHSDIAMVHIADTGMWIEQEPFPYRCNTLADVPDSCVIYADRDVIRSLVRRGFGEMTMRENAIMRWECEGKTVFPLPQELEVTLDDLCLWREWVESEGAGIRSRSGTAVSMLRATLQKEFQYVGDWPNVEQIVGGRFHATQPKMHPSIEVWDMRSAYANTLAHLPSGRWVRNGNDSIENEDEIAIALATIYVGGRGLFGPLPQRDGVNTHGHWWEEWFLKRPYPQRVTITGIWSADEIRSALKHGARIEQVHRLWKLRVEDYPFLQWWEAIQRGRKLPGVAGDLGKITGNTLWGVFATRENPWHKVKYVDGKRITTELPAKKPFHRNYPLAELITAKVRARVYDELIVPAGDNLISVCVDGGLVAPGFVASNQDWRIKDRGKLCGFINPYCLMYRREDGTTVYKCSGVPERKREAFFRSIQHRSYGSGRIGMKLRRALDGSALETALAEDAISASFGG